MASNGSSNFRPGPPTHELVVSQINSKRRTVAGVLWVHPDSGAMTLHLNPSVVLQETPGLRMHIYPMQPTEKKSQGAGRNARRSSSTGERQDPEVRYDHPDDEDLPF